jgi:hypothetical protein
VNDKVYIHEFIDITKQNRSRYMHHMTANWSPIGQEQRNQLCYGVWGVVGSTGRWPEVVNIWEEDGFSGLASSFRHEFDNTTLQDPALEKWWAAAADLRSGGIDRLIVPHPEMPTINEICDRKPHFEVYAHEVIEVGPGEARQALRTAVDESHDAAGSGGWTLTGAWSTAMRNDEELILLWGIPTWEAWAEVEQRETAGERVLLKKTAPSIRARERVLLADSPLCPFKTGRQPRRSDRVDWVD